MLPRIVTVTAVANQAATLATWLAIHASAFDRTCPSASPSLPSQAARGGVRLEPGQPRLDRRDDPGDERDDCDREKDHHQADHEDRQQGHGARRLGPGPAPITQPGRDRREQDGDDHGEQDRSDDGPQDDREIGEDDDQGEHHEDAPSDRGRVAEPGRNQRPTSLGRRADHSPTVRRFSQVR